MFLDVTKAFVRPMEDFPFEVEVALGEQDINGDKVTFDSVKVSGIYSMLDDVVTLEGELHTVAHGPCALCMETASANVDVDFRETFRKDADEEEDGCFSYTNKQLPLDHMTLTLVLLNMPMRFQCDHDCTGGVGLTAWDEEKTVWAEEGESEQQGTYRPFEGLADLLENNEENPQ